MGLPAFLLLFRNYKINNFAPCELSQRWELGHGKSKNDEDDKRSATAYMYMEVKINRVSLQLKGYHLHTYLCDLLFHNKKLITEIYVFTIHHQQPKLMCRAIKIY